MSKRIAYPLAISLLIISVIACATSTPAPPESPATDPPPVATPTPAADSTLASSDPPATQPVESTPAPASDRSYRIVDTGQTTCYDDASAISCPAAGEPFYGQDAQFTGNAPSTTDNGDGTVTDHVTGLTWQQSPDTDGDGDIDAQDKLTYADAVAYCENLTLEGADDWWLPSIKQLYSLIDFSGADPSGRSDAAGSNLSPFIDATTFRFAYGDEGAGERLIDAQFASSTPYVATVMNDRPTIFGVNFADGRIKGYPQDLAFYVLCVRGNAAYGENDLVDNGDGTITDQATGLMWGQDDSGSGMTWEQALAWVEVQNAANHLGYSDWRLPSAKELQSVVDYTRSPDTTNSAAIDPLFNVTSITNEAGQADYPAYWSSTTHANQRSGENAAYVTFGRGMGYMHGAWMDVHGAGAQRSDPKSGDPAEQPVGNGPQGDAVRIYNTVRLVRGGDAASAPAGDPSTAGGESPPGDAPGQGGELGPPGGDPPQEAIDACLNRSEGSTCTVDAPEGEISGTCRRLQEQLVCVPEGGPPDRDQ